MGIKGFNQSGDAFRNLFGRAARGDSTGRKALPLEGLRAAGGIVEINGSYTTHMFVSPGPGGFEPDTSQNFIAYQSLPGVLFFVIGGGGGGGYAGGGGSGGAVSNAITGNTITVSAGTYPVTIGGGGQSKDSWSETSSNSPSFPTSQPGPVSVGPDGNREGDNSVWNGYTGLGGGSGGQETGPAGYSNNPTYPEGKPGGSGGGGANYGGNGPRAAGSATQPGQSQGPNGTNYGSSGGSAASAGTNYTGGGGGGIGGAGANTPPSAGGVGGVGLKVPICPPNYGTPGPSPGRWLGGGGGSSQYPGTSYSGGAGGGNDGNLPYDPKATIYTNPVNPGTGGGGGGGTGYNNKYSTRGNPGCVIVAYPT